MSDELLETHCTVPIENVEPGTFAMRDWIGKKTNHWLTYRQCSEFLAHLRSQTPPHAVTREQIAKHLYDEEHKRCRNVWKWEDSGLDDEHPGARDRYYRYADAILALLAEKPASTRTLFPLSYVGVHAGAADLVPPAPTATPLTLTGEDRAFLTGLISHHKERRHDVVVQTLTELRERLSASPTPTPLTLTEEERALAKEAATITDDDAELTARALRLLGAHNTADEIKKLVTAHGRLGRALERLSASPTPTPLTLTEEERGLVEANRNWVPGLIAIIDRLSASPTAPKGEA